MAEKGRHTRKSDAALIGMLAGGMTARAAAVKAGMSETTVYRRLASPAFRAAVADAQREVVARATARLAGASTAAAGTLRRLLSSKTERVQLAAARWTLGLLIDLQSHTELEGRIAALEQKLLDKGETPP